MVDAVRTHLSCLSDIVPETRYFFGDDLSFEPAQTEEMIAQLPLLRTLESILETETGEFSGLSFNTAVKAAGAKAGCKGKALYHPIRLALTGRENGPELAKIAPLLGRERVLARLRVWTHPGSP
jgi:glutamyl/glutaminyl-tRNA synthetase